MWGRCLEDLINLSLQVADNITDNMPGPTCRQPANWFKMPTQTSPLPLLIKPAWYNLLFNCTPQTLFPKAIHMIASQIPDSERKSKIDTLSTF